MASSPMKVIHEGRWIKLYRATKDVHTYPGVHLWLHKGRGHLRLWPLPWRVVR